MPGLFSSCKSEDPAPKTDYSGTIAVVGAGASGLYIADILKAKGIKVVLLEASDRVGGRVRTLKANDKPSASLLFNSQSELGSDFPNELGATFIKGSDSAWSKFVQELKINTVNLTSTTVDNYVVDGSVMSAAALASDADFIAAKNFLDNLASQSGASAVEDAIAAAGINERMYSILNAWIGNNYSSSNDRMGMQAVAEAYAMRTRDHDLFTLVNNPMEDALLSRFSKVVEDVRVNSVVKQIDYTGSTVVITGDNTKTGEPFSLEVEKVVVTVPISILKNNSIAFTPGLPASKSAALNTMAMDASFRVILDFKSNFWGATSGFLYGAGEAPEYFNGGVGRSDLGKTLSVTISGPKATGYSLMGKNSLPLLINELDSLFNGKASTGIRMDGNDNMVAIIQDWTLDPYIRGGGSYSKPGGTNQHRVDLAAPVNDKVFFAGEATDITGDFGTINGALLSAERAAKEVGQAIGV